jgi:hypothetical protein
MIEIEYDLMSFGKRIGQFRMNRNSFKKSGDHLQKEMSEGTYYGTD